MALLVLYEARKTALSNLIDTGALLDPGQLSFGLVAGNNSWNVDSTRDDVLAKEVDTGDWSTYATIPMTTWSAIYRDGAGNVFVDGPLVEWVTDDGLTTTPLLISAVYWDNGNQLLVDTLVPGINLTGPDQAVRYIPQFAYGQ